MNRVYIIAEAGVNHNGDFTTALWLIDAAVEAGADAIKFQTFSADALTSRHGPKAEYQILATGNTESQYEMLKKLALTDNNFIKLFDYCRKKNIDFLSSPFDISSVEFLHKIGLKTWKIPSGEITNLPLLRLIGSFVETVFLSTGMSTIDEIRNAVNILVKSGTAIQSITLLHCTTEYPAPFDQVNLNALKTIKTAFGTPIGYSDHTRGIEVAISAVALESTVIEKHLTLGNNQEGPDHRASLNPADFKKMVKAIRNIEKSFGSGRKIPSAAELKNKVIVRKSIVASTTIKKGDLFSEKNITTKRPGTGISPMCWDDVIGKISPCNFEIDDQIRI